MLTLRSHLVLAAFLPDGCQAFSQDGSQYFSCSGVVYAPFYDNGNLAYTVVSSSS